MPKLLSLVADPVAQPTEQPRPAGGALATAGRALERLGQVGVSIYDAEQKAKARAASASVAIDLQRKAFELDADPDYDTAEDRFETFRSETLKKYGEGITGPYRADFEQASTLAAERFGFQVSAGVRERRIDAGRAFTDEAVQKNINAASMSLDLGEREHFRAEAFKDIDGAVAGGLLTAQEGVARKEQADKELRAGEIREGLRLDPQGTYRMLSDPNGPYFGRMPESERQAYLGMAQEASEQQIASRFAAMQRQLAMEERLQRRDSDAAESELLTMMQTDDLGFAPPEEINERLSRMTPEAKSRWINIAHNGGQLGEARKLDPEVYTQLRRDANAGLDISGPATDALLRGDLGAGASGRAVFDSLMDDSSGRRFKPARQWLDTVMEPKAGPLAILDQGAKQRYADAMLAFDSWVKAHPEASDVEAIEQAQKVAGAIKPEPPENAEETKAQVFERALERVGFPPGTDPREAKALDPNRYQQALAEALADPAVREALQ